MKKFALALSLVASAVSLVACGGGSSPAPLVATANEAAPITAASVGAVSGQSFSFNSGVSSLGTATPTTLKFDTPSTFTVSSTEGTASGDLSFGSCIFTVRKSTYPAISKLGTGKVVEVQPCNLNVAIQGTVTTAGPAPVSVAFNLGGTISLSQNFTVDLLEDGTVVVNGVSLGTVTVTPATGSTGGA